MEMGFTHKIIGGVEYLSIPAFERAGRFRHGFSTRAGGVSEGGYASMNLGLSRGDKRGRVLENYRRFAHTVGVTLDSLVLSAQAHTDNIRYVTEADRGRGLSRDGFTDVDALVTDRCGVTLVTFYADCTPIFLGDPARGVIGLAHSGWRGTVRKIGAKTVAFMIEKFGCDPADILAGIGPCAGPCCYEVSEEVGRAIDEAGGGGCLRFAPGSEKPFADLWTANVNILIQAGLRPENITLCGQCTCHNPDRYFTHRGQGAARGSLAAFLALHD